MSESVKILIEADDQASRKMEAATRNVEQNVKRIKTAGEQTKKSIEFSGAFANALGGTQFGSFASQIAQMTEKTSQFAEVSKLGGGGALAFKTGLVGMVGVLSFGVGKALGDAIFQTEKWKQKLAEATEESKKLGQRTLQSIGANRSIVDREIGLLNKDDQKAAREKELQATRSAMETHANKQRALKKELESWGTAWLIGGRQSEEIKNELMQAETYLDSFRQRAEQLESQVSLRALDIQAAEESKAVKELIASEKERLAIQDVEIAHGREMARILELQKKGVDAKTAAELAAHEKRLEMLQRESQDLQSTESRTLSRSPTNRDWQLRAVIQDAPVAPQPDIAQKLESVLERMTQRFGEEIAKGFREQPKIVMEPL